MEVSLRVVTLSGETMMIICHSHRRFKDDSFCEPSTTLLIYKVMYPASHTGMCGCDSLGPLNIIIVSLELVFSFELNS